MVIAGVLISQENEKKLKSLGAKDSKLLTPKEREELFPKIKEMCEKFEIIIVHPKEVDDAVFGIDGLNLNSLEAKHTVNILNTLKPDTAYIDCPSTNTQAYKQLLQSKIPSKMKIIAEHKADVNYPSVAAASILAKVVRDQEIEKIKEEIGIDFGSGYLSDPKTSKFLKEHHSTHPHLFRKSWAPYAKAVSSKFQQSLESFSESLIKTKIDPLLEEKLRKLKGYESVPVSSTYEHLRLKGICTITLYTTGKLLIQGDEGEKQRLEKLLK